MVLNPITDGLEANHSGCTFQIASHSPSGNKLLTKPSLQENKKSVWRAWLGDLLRFLFQIWLVSPQNIYALSVPGLGREERPGWAIGHHLPERAATDSRAVHTPRPIPDTAESMGSFKSNTFLQVYSQGAVDKFTRREGGEGGYRDCDHHSGLTAGPVLCNRLLF